METVSFKTELPAIKGARLDRTDDLVALVISVKNEADRTHLAELESHEVATLKVSADGETITKSHYTMSGKAIEIRVAQIGDFIFWNQTGLTFILSLPFDHFELSDIPAELLVPVVVKPSLDSYGSRAEDATNLPEWAR